MATTFSLIGSEWNQEILAEAWLYESGGDAIDILPAINGDIVLTPPVVGTFDVVPQGEVVASIAGPTTAGSLDIPILSRTLTGVVATANKSLTDVLWQNTGNGFDPYTEVTMSGFDGDTSGEIVVFSPRAKVWRIDFVLQPARGGTAQAVRGTTISVYAKFPSQPLTMAKVGGASTSNIKGEIPRRGMITITNI